MIQTLERTLRTTLPGLQIRLHTRQLFVFISQPKHNMFKFMGTEINANLGDQTIPIWTFA